MRPYTPLIAFLLLVPPAFAAPTLEQLAGTHTRAVWVQDLSKGSRDTFAWGQELRLAGLDSRDGKGERVILEKVGNCVKPMFTPDGKRIVFSDRHANAVHAIDWDGSGLRTLCRGIAVDVVADPDGKRVWVYYMTESPKPRDKRKLPLRRHELDGARDELVWDQTALSIDNFHVSRDLTHASGLFPWPDGGIAELPNRRWTKLAGGCWTSLAPDDSYLFWIFDGPHRNVYVHNRAGSSWLLCIGDGPGMNGFEVYHPRWSNHPRFIAVTGPYLGNGGKPGGNRIGQGGQAVEVYAGRLSPDFKAVEAWCKITSNQVGDFFPDLWVSGGETVNVPKAVAGVADADPMTDQDLAEFKVWPGIHEGLVFLWENSKVTNTVLDPDGKPVRSCKVIEHGKAIYTPDFGMDLRDGAVFAQDVDKVLLDACRASNQLGIEVTLIPPDLTQSGPARIVSFSLDPGQRNFTLGQSNEWLVFRLRTPQTGANGTNPEVKLCKLMPGKPHHVVVSYLPGKLTCVVNGEPVRLSDTVRGDFSNWEQHHLLFGDEWTRDRDWDGMLEGVAIYARAIGQAEAEKRFALYSRKLQDRPRRMPLIVQAKLVAKTATPAPEDIAPYRRCLGLYAYDVERVVSGICQDKRIAVAHWVILDSQALPDNRAVGRSMRLLLEPFDDHPQLKSERLAIDLDEIDLEQYIDLSR